MEKTKDANYYTAGQMKLIADAEEGYILSSRDLPAYEKVLREHGMATRTFLDTDAVTGKEIFSLYTDDGAGNGNHILSVDYNLFKALLTVPNK